MKLRDRYRRLTLWNKLAVWGSLASIFGILLTVGMPMCSGSRPLADQGSARAESPANVELTFSPRSAVLGKVLPRMAANGTVAPVQIEVGLKNSGEARAVGAVVTLTFRRGMSPRVIEGNWRENARMKDYGIFTFEDSQLPVYAGSGRHVDTFELQLPAGSGPEDLLAVFQVHGDFGRKEGLLFYDRGLDEYRWSHTSTANEAFTTWNEQVMRWNAEAQAPPNDQLQRTRPARPMAPRR